MELEGMHESSLSGLFSDFGDLGRSSVEAYTRSDTSGFGIRVMGGSGYSFQVPDYSALDTARIFKIIAPGGTSYILPVRQQESGQVSFQNLVIYKGEHGQATFLVTNHPDAEWVDQYRESGEFYHFRGKINVRKLSGYVTTFEAQELEALLMSSPGSGKFQSYSNQQCFIISQYIVTEYRCTCAGQHTLAQIAQCTCTQEGGLAPHYQTNAVPVTVCFGIDTDVDPPGVDPGFGGGGGNGVPIGSIPPEDYGPIGNIGDLGEQLAVQLSITNPQVVNFLNNNPDIALSLHNYLQAISAYDPNANAFGKWTAEFLAANTNLNLSDLLYNRTPFDAATGDYNNNTAGGYDMNTYQEITDLSIPWQNISPVITSNHFVGWNSLQYPTWECMDYAKAQIGTLGYAISNYYDVDDFGLPQTFQGYKNGTANSNELKKGISYIKYALQNSIPVIVGVDYRAGHPGNIDNTTDHFIVIVGMGYENGKNFLRYYDNAFGDPIKGTHSSNKLYYDTSTGLMRNTIKSNPQYDTGIFGSESVEYDYILTMIRKSKLKL